MALPTANWDSLGQQVFKKQEFCQLQWGAKISLDEYDIFAASYGGPIALLRKELPMRKVNYRLIEIFTALGDQLSTLTIKDVDIITIGWSHQEDLVCVHANGFISLYDLFGQHISTLTLDQEIRDSKIIECKVFTTINRTGVAILTQSLSFYLYNNLYHLKLRRLAEIPYLNERPLCWDIISFDSDTKLIVSREKELIILKSQDLSCTLINPFDDEQSKETVTLLRVSFDYSHIVLFTETGKLYLALTANDISTHYSMFDTESKTKPKQLAWCGNDVVAAHWANLLFLVDMDRNWLKYPTYGHVHMIQEIDCIRVVDNSFQEMITKVDKAAVDIFKIGSVSSGSNLLEASRLFDQQNHKVDDYIRLIQEKNEMEMAVNMCLETACHEFNVATQKMLLRAASFGKCFTANMDNNKFVRVCQELRILNAIRKPDVGIPLTHCQFEQIKIDSLIDRLTERHHFFLALKLAEYLKIVPEDGSIKILTRWAFYKIRQQDIDEEKIANQIAQKISPNSGVSFAEIANKAIEYGRKNLAIRLLDYELKATDQVPLLLKLKEYRRALQGAIESGNTNLIYMVVLSFKKIQTSEQFYLGLREYPVAYSLYQKYCKQDDQDQLQNIYFQENDLIAEGLTYLEQCCITQPLSLTANERKSKMSLVSSALDTFKKSRNDFLTTHTDEYSRLLKYQLKLEDKFSSTTPTGLKFFDLSLQDTMRLLLQRGEYKLSDELRKEFKVPDKRYYYLRLITMAEMDEWLELERFSKAKKSPIGYEPFVDVCIQRQNRYEAQKYLPKIRDENKIKYYIKTGNLEDAAKFAFDKKDVEALSFILTKCSSPSIGGSSHHRMLQEKIRTMIGQISK
nr:vacuolar protein sorting-associated protein 16 homolog [Dermatophagoides farinae]